MKAKHPKTKLVKLIIVRHGEYGSDGRLTEFGREQINRLAKLIAKRIKRHTKKIMVASPAKRTLETADILKEHLNIAFTAEEFLQTDSGVLSEHKGLLAIEFLSKSVAQLVIFVTHYEYGIYFPSVLASRYLGTCIATRELSRGAARIICCKSGSMEDIGGR
ncbi:MAG: hypothetical protein A2928_02175 [Candidatus Taylorbacteria bacterium RIFCSPLOWO2_01_FULL_45_15b]|uniref:Phosphohistidine phosphatase SixA n=1 Tax=Candidatus Taylorbacteria bacterium RIFCSPLOWO2_01_FULL_45_15b TaxID=1802319 RepID=A0A1G2N712_9BACT|nr:MAG: hypothetical protein A2928_02175 [Candidatus Taylorbacteria bacterium RIFCSPLOWO2_01_FULL_45_15b]